MKRKALVGLAMPRGEEGKWSSGAPGASPASFQPAGSDSPPEPAPSPSCKERARIRSRGALSPPAVPTAAKHFSAQATRKDVTDFAHGRMAFRFWPFRQKTVKAKRKI